MINQRAPLIGLTKKPGQQQFARVMMIDIATGLNGLVIDEEMGEAIKALNLESQFNVEKINSMQPEYLARALNSLGVDSLQAFGKKERMIVDEVESNDEALAMILSDRLMARTKPLINNKTAEEYKITCKLAKPYRISTNRENNIEYTSVEMPAGDDNKDVIFVIDGIGIYSEHVKPYLFPLSSMTEWQDRELENLMKNSIESCGMLSPYDCLEMERFFNENHLDWRGLIPMGLAIDATGLNIY